MIAKLIFVKSVARLVKLAHYLHSPFTPICCGYYYVFFFFFTLRLFGEVSGLGEIACWHLIL